MHFSQFQSYPISFLKIELCCILHILIFQNRKLRVFGALYWTWRRELWFLRNLWLTLTKIVSVCFYTSQNFRLLIKSMCKCLIFDAPHNRMNAAVKPSMLRGYHFQTMDRTFFFKKEFFLKNTVCIVKNTPTEPFSFIRMLCSLIFEQVLIFLWRNSSL